MATNRALRAVRESLNLSQNEMADALLLVGRQSGVDLHISARHVAKWETGQIGWPQGRYRRVLETLTGVPCTELGFSPPPSKDGNNSEEDAVQRRQFLSAAITTAGLGVSGQLFGNAGPRSVAKHLDGVENTIGQLRALDRKFGSEQLLPVMNQQLQGVQRMLAASAGDSARVQTLAGRVFQLAGWMHFDAGRQVRARALYKEALFLAQSAGARDLIAQTFSTMSRQSRLFGDGREAVQFARLGAESAPSSGRVAALLASCEAGAYARLGDKEMAVAAIRRARSVLTDRSDDPSWVDFFREGELDGAEAEDVADVLGDWDWAESSARAAAADTTLAQRAQTSCQLHLAKVLVCRGDLQGGQEVMAGVEPTLPDLSSARIRAYVAGVLGALPAVSRKRDEWRRFQVYA